MLFGNLCWLVIFLETTKVNKKAQDSLLISQTATLSCIKHIIDVYLSKLIFLRKRQEVVWEIFVFPCFMMCYKALC